MNDDIDTRLAALETRQPVDLAPPALVMVPPRRRRALALVVAPLLVLTLAATALAGPTISELLVRGAPGVENPGQPLHGANLECMSPPQAAAYLAAHGYTDVVWQIETTAKDPAATTSRPAPTLVAVPPRHGYVIPGSVIDGRLHMIVDQRPGATGVGACFGTPMP
jgi:hypothetical protein